MCSYLKDRNTYLNGSVMAYRWLENDNPFSSRCLLRCLLTVSSISTSTFAVAGSGYVESGYQKQLITAVSFVSYRYRLAICSQRYSALCSFRCIHLRKSKGSSRGGCTHSEIYGACSTYIKPNRIRTRLLF